MELCGVEVDAFVKLSAAQQLRRGIDEARLTLSRLEYLPARGSNVVEVVQSCNGRDAQAWFLGLLLLLAAWMGFPGHGRVSFLGGKGSLTLKSTSQCSQNQHLP